MGPIPTGQPGALASGFEVDLLRETVEKRAVARPPRRQSAKLFPSKSPAGKMPVLQEKTHPFSHFSTVSARTRWTFAAVAVQTHALHQFNEFTVGEKA